MALDLAALVAAIKQAEEGGVITPEYHNSVRDAIIEMAKQLGAASSGPTTVTATFAPAFLPVQDDKKLISKPWILGIGVASTVFNNDNEAWGWMPVALPNGARITRLLVRGVTPGAENPFKLSVSIVRQPVSLVTGPIPGTETVTTVAEVTSLDLDGVEATPLSSALAQVDNTNFKYLVKARAAGAPNKGTLQIRAIHIDYQLG